MAGKILSLNRQVLITANLLITNHLNLSPFEDWYASIKGLSELLSKDQADVVEGSKENKVFAPSIGLASC